MLPGRVTQEEKKSPRQSYTQPFRQNITVYQVIFLSNLEIYNRPRENKRGIPSTVDYRGRGVLPTGHERGCFEPVLVFFLTECRCVMAAVKH